MTDGRSDLFGGSRAWNPSDWTASDDRVRGGSSHSYFDCSPSQAYACFHGYLDSKTLGGAGFASQRTTEEDKSWDLGDYDGLRIEVGHASHMTFTINIKDELLEKNPENGREQATVSWEHDVQLNVAKGGPSMIIEIPWDEFKPTYRGKPKDDAGELNTKAIRRFSFMVRSFFGDQQGRFAIQIRSISAYKGGVCRVGKDLGYMSSYQDNDAADPSETEAFEDEKRLAAYHSRPRSGGLLGFLHCLCPSD